jgi:hypothetical protein
MLLTDGSPNTTEDLRAYESAVLSVAHAEMIDVGVKLNLASEEIAQDVLEFLLNRTSGTDPRGAARRSTGVADVVVTRQMKRWHVLHTLALFYRDAFHNQLNDRYKAKWEEYRALARQARERTYLSGVGLVREPLPAPGVPRFAYVAGPFEARTYFGQVAWVSGLGAESAPSAMSSFEAPEGSVPVVEATNPPGNAVGFHVYLGLTPQTLARQTGTAVAAGDAFVLPASGLVAGAVPGEGQSPDMYVTGEPVLRRG